MQTKHRAVVRISFEQLERISGLADDSIRNIYVNPVEECLMIVTDDVRIAYPLTQKAQMPIHSFNEYPIELKDEDSIKEGETLS